MKTSIYQALFENSISAIFIGNPENGHLIDVNDAAASMFGYSKKEFLNLKRDDLFDHNHVSMIDAVKSRQKKGSVKGELIGIKKNGEHFSCEFTSSIFKTDSGELRSCTILNDISEKKKYSEELFFSKQQNELLLNNIDDAVWSIITDYKLIKGNDAFTSALKFSLGVDLRPGDSVINNKDFPENVILIWKALYDRALLGNVVTEEIHLPEYTGTEWEWCLVKLKPIWKDGKIEGVFGLNKNFAIQKAAECKVKENAELLDKLTKNIPAAIYQFKIDVDGKMTFPFISHGILNLNSNLDIELFKSDSSSGFALVHPDDLPMLMQSILESKNTLGDWKLEFRYFNEKNEVIWVEGAAKPEKSINGSIVWHGYFSEITQRKLSEKIILDAKVRYDIIAKATNDTVWDIDIEQDNVVWNKGIKRIFGYSEHDDKINERKWWLTKIHPDDVDRIKIETNEWLKSKTPRWESQYRFLCADNTYKFVYDRGFLTVNENNEVVRIIGAMQDITDRKIVEEKLRASELKFKTIFDAEPECVKLIGPKGNLLEINRAGIELHEACSIDEMRAIPISDFLLPQYRDKFNELHQQTMQGGSGKLEFELMGLKGTRRWVEAYSVPFRDKSGNVVMMLSVSRDITDRKLAESKIIESERKLKNIFSAVPECIKLLNVAGDVLEMNETGLAMLEVDSIDKINALRLDSFILPQYQSRFLDLHFETVNGNSGVLEFEVVGLKGTKRWLETNTVPIYNSENGVEGVLAVTRDVTINKQKEYTLKLLESVITNTTDLVMITNVESRGMFGPEIVFVNESFEKITGYTKEELFGKSPRILQGDKTERNELKKMSLAMSKFIPTEITIINYKKSGEEFWVNFSISPVSNEVGEYTHWIAVGRDVTQQKKNELEKEQMIAELSQNNKDLKHFSYVTSHNLRAPIANLLGLTSLIDNFKIPNKSLKQIIDGIRQSALMFDDTVKDLTKVLVIKDKTNIVRENVSFVDAFNKVLNHLSISVTDNSIKVNYEFDNAPFVKFTATYLDSILLNLVTNSIKYKSLKRKLKIDIISKQTNDGITLIYKDNGIGIDVELHKDKLFKLYQRFHDNPDGKGLGLYLIKSQMEALGGSINIESEVGKGTTFIMKFKN